MAPRNLLVTALGQLMLALLLVVPIFAAAYAGTWFSRVPFVGMACGLAVAVAVFLLFVAGVPNPHNANDNTSGVLALLEIAAALPKEHRGQVALVFFDNEEKGLVGASAFRAAHRGTDDKLLVNFDCVGVGKTMLFVLPAKLRRDEAARRELAAAFAEEGGITPLVDTSPLTIYPSDQMLFKRGVGVVALRRSQVAGLYVSRIHTARDTEVNAKNILFLKEGSLRLAAAVCRRQNAGALAAEAAVN